MTLLLNFTRVLALLSVFNDPITLYLDITGWWSENYSRLHSLSEIIGAKKQK